MSKSTIRTCLRTAPPAITQYHGTGRVGGHHTPDVPHHTLVTFFGGEGRCTACRQGHKAISILRDTSHQSRGKQIRENIAAVKLATPPRHAQAPPRRHGCTQRPEGARYTYSNPRRHTLCRNGSSSLRKACTESSWSQPSQRTTQGRRTDGKPAK